MRDTEPTPDFDPDGPYSHDTTARAAARIGELARYLNHATASPAGVPYPATAYAVTGSLAETAARLHQLLQQLSYELQRMLRDEHIEIDRGPFAGKPAHGVTDAVHELRGAQVAASNLELGLRRAQQAVTWMSIRVDEEI